MSVLYVSQCIVGPATMICKTENKMKAKQQA
jgi:hypothetical protein